MIVWKSVVTNSVLLGAFLKQCRRIKYFLVSKDNSKIDL